MNLDLDLNCRDTICALATPGTRSALCIVRVSGAAVPKIKDAIFRPKKGNQKNFVATFGDIVDVNNNIVDECICVYSPDIRSFTGEPCLEFSLHGNPVIAQALLNLLQKHGCRLAGPGEFSLRAVLNGKLNISQAESIADLIDAQSQKGTQIALRNLKGGLEQALAPIRDAILFALCEIEARLDFPDEDLGEKQKQELQDKLNDQAEELSKILERSQHSAKLLKGVRIVLFGKPNVGKSTLVNTLVGHERSIVHASEGTTRDVLEVDWQVEDIPAVLVDVAGIREGNQIHPVEEIGIQRAKKEFERADLILHLIDSTKRSEPMLQLPKTDAPIIEIFTKSDLSDAMPVPGILLSARTGEGIEKLLREISGKIKYDLPGTDEIALTRNRHVELVRQTHDALLKGAESLALGFGDECTALELREAGASLDALLGRNLNEDVLDLIFSRFCIGK